MYSHQYVYQVLKTSHVPGIYFCYPEGKAPSPPWFTYRLDQDKHLAADNKVYTPINKYRVELYMKAYDSDLVNRFHSIIESNFGAHTIQEIWIDEEQCFMVVYTFTYIPREEE